MPSPVRAGRDVPFHSPGLDRATQKQFEEFLKKREADGGAGGKRGEGEKPQRRSCFLELTTTNGQKVDGEALGKEVKGADSADLIIVDSWRWGMAVSSAEQTSTNSYARGAVEPNVFHFSQQFDRSTPTLLAHCSAGRALDKMVFTMYRSTSKASGGQYEKFMTITLEDVFCTSVSIDHGDPLPKLEVDVMYDTIDIEYWRFDADGSRTGDIQKFGWEPQTTGVKLGGSDFA